MGELTAEEHDAAVVALMHRIYGKQFRTDLQKKYEKRVDEQQKQIRVLEQKLQTAQDSLKWYAAAATRWEGKFHTVARENNALRRKLFAKTKATAKAHGSTEESSPGQQ